MSFEFIETAEAIKRSGLRMTVVGGVPSAWSEAAKGVFHVKNLDWAAVRLEPGNEEQTGWTKHFSAPCVMYEDDQPVSTWNDILFLAERLQPEPSLLPREPLERTLAMELSHELMGVDGLARARRLQLVHGGLQGEEGFSEPVSKYLASKYGYDSKEGESAGIRVCELLGTFAGQLKNQRELGSRFYLGRNLTCVDIYSAVTIALFQPLPEADCQMKSTTRQAFESLDNTTKAVLDPILLEHRDYIYNEFLALPVLL